MQFVACEISVGDPHAKALALDQLRQYGEVPVLILSTCQRLEVFGQFAPDEQVFAVLTRHEKQAAFERLARIAAGLESRILGELEILGQVREAYREFQQAGGAAHTKLDRVFQDALSLARSARRESGIDQNLTSLGSLASRALMERIPATAHVAVVGAGSLAGSVARYLKKRGNFPVRVSSRCPENALSLALEVGGFGGALDELAHLLKDVSGIVTATAAPHPIVYEHHLADAARPLTIVDLGVPPDCSPEVKAMPGISYIPLSEIEAKAQINSEDRRQRAEVAARIIREGAIAWAQKH